MKETRARVPEQCLKLFVCSCRTHHIMGFERPGTTAAVRLSLQDVLRQIATTATEWRQHPILNRVHQIVDKFVLFAAARKLSLARLR